MKILALIPARGGSKRVPRKNLRLLGGLPLIAWTIRSALESHVFIDVVVSTDDFEIASVAKKHGAFVPKLRPAALATDTATSVDVALYELNEYEAANGPVDALMLLQPTSPFRTVENIRECVGIFMESKQESVVSVAQAEPHPAWCIRIKQEKIVPVLGWDGFKCRSQDLEAVYILNGTIYLVTPEFLRTERSFLNERSAPLVMSSPSALLDIDTEFDWLIAEAFLKVPYEKR